MNVKYLLPLIPAVLLMLVSPSTGQIVGMDDFDGNEMFISRTITPDTSGNAVPGTFTTNVFDVFGIVDRNINIDFQDDTLANPDVGASPGLFGTTVTDMFFGVEDLENDANMDGTGQIVYEFDIAGATDLQFSADFAAMGDFEVTNDIFTISASIDGGASETLIAIVVDEEATLTYTFEDGSTADENDPLTIDGTFLNNSFQNFSASISGTGNELTLTLDFANNGGNELLAINNILIESSMDTGIVGDVNCDGVVDLLDVAPFVEALTNGSDNPKADIDGSGTVDLLDVAPFVALLTG